MTNDIKNTNEQLANMVAFKNKLEEILIRINDAHFIDGEALDVPVTIAIEDVSLTLDIGADVYSSLEHMIDMEIRDHS